MSLLVLMGVGAWLIWMGLHALTTGSWGMPAWAGCLLLAEGLAHTAVWSWFLAWFVRRRLTQAG